EAALRRVRDIILGADASMRERIQYGITFSSTKGGDFAAFVRYSEAGVNLRLMRGRRLHGRYPHLEGTAVKRMPIADVTEASARGRTATRGTVESARGLGRGARTGRRAAPRALYAGSTAWRPAGRGRWPRPEGLPPRLRARRGGATGRSSPGSAAPTVCSRWR